MYTEDNDLEIKLCIKHLLLEWRTIINHELYEEKVIDLKVYYIVK